MRGLSGSLNLLQWDSLGGELYRDTLGLFVSSAVEPIDLEVMRELGLGILTPSKDGYPSYYSKYLKQIPKSIPIRMSSESLECLYQCASAETFVACLPKSVGQRHHLLKEIKADFLKFSGEHSIYLVGHKNCDRTELDYVATEIQSV